MTPIAQNLRGKLQHDVAMAQYVSWRAGGRADMLYEPADLDDLSVFLQQLPLTTPVYWIGLGSNLLVRDGGGRGVIIRLHGALRELRLETVNDGVPGVYAEAGVALPKVARFCANHVRAGAQFMAGIPGTGGGALAMNAGGYGSEAWAVTAAVLTMDRAGQMRRRVHADYSVAYRHVQAAVPVAQEWFVGAWFALVPGDGQLSRQKITELLRRRIDSQPLNQPNAGSVFRNPPGDHAARLIESCGLKGKQIGGAQVSMKHANFIVNSGHASAADIEELMAYVADSVARTTGVRLEHEVRIIGERMGAIA